MALMIRQIAEDDPLDAHLALDALARVVPAATVAAVLAECGAAGLRVMAVDGTTLDVPDTPANVRAFGRQPTPRGGCAWPRVQLVALSECGTHAVCDAGVWAWDADERAAGRRLLRSVGRGVLLLW